MTMDVVGTSAFGYAASCCAANFRGMLDIAAALTYTQTCLMPARPCIHFLASGLGTLRFLSGAAASVVRYEGRHLQVRLQLLLNFSPTMHLLAVQGAVAHAAQPSCTGAQGRLAHARRCGVRGQQRRGCHVCACGGDHIWPWWCATAASVQRFMGELLQSRQMSMS